MNLTHCTKHFYGNDTLYVDQPLTPPQYISPDLLKVLWAATSLSPDTIKTRMDNPHPTIHRTTPHMCTYLLP